MEKNRQVIYNNGIIKNITVSNTKEQSGLTVALYFF